MLVLILLAAPLKTSLANTSSGQFFGSNASGHVGGTEIIISVQIVNCVGFQDPLFVLGEQRSWEPRREIDIIEIEYTDANGRVHVETKHTRDV